MIELGIEQNDWVVESEDWKNGYIQAVKDSQMHQIEMISAIGGIIKVILTDIQKWLIWNDAYSDCMLL